MAFVSEDRVKETSSTTGTGDFTLDGAVTGFKAFSEVCSTADTFFYAIVNNVSGEFEIGEGTFTAGGALQRDTVLSSSNSDAAVNFGSGSKDVFLTAPADSLIQSDTDGEVSKSTSFSSGTFFFNDVTFDGITTGRDIVFDRSVNALEFRDNASAVFGTGSDFSITHDGLDTYLNQSGTGELRFGSSSGYDIQYFDGSAFRLLNNFELQFGTNNSFEMEYNSSSTAMVFNDNQTSKDLRFQQAGSDKIIFSFNNWEFQDGVQASFGNGSDLSIIHDGTDSSITNDTGDLLIQNSSGSDFVKVDCNLDSENPALILGILDNVNISSSAGIKSIMNTADIKLNRGNWTVTSSRITCGSGQDGLYYIAVDLRFDSAVQRIAPMVLIRRNGSNITQYSATGYIRNSSGHNNASLHQEVVCSLANGDYIEFNFANDGLAGNANTIIDYGYGVRVIRLPMTYEVV